MFTSERAFCDNSRRSLRSSRRVTAWQDRWHLDAGPWILNALDFYKSYLQRNLLENILERKQFQNNEFWQKTKHQGTPLDFNVLLNYPV